MLKKLFLSSLLLGNICLIGDCKSTEEIDNLLVDANVAKLETKISPEEFARRVNYFCTRPEKPNLTDITDRQNA